MNFRRRSIRFFLPLYAHLLLLAPVVAQTDSTGGHFDEGLYFLGGYSSLDKPILRGPNGYQELPVPQTLPTTGYMGGYESIGERFGFGIGTAYWGVSLSDFRSSVFENSPQPSTFDVRNAEFSLFLFDLVIHVLPWESGPVSVFGHLGMGWRSDSYLVSGAQSPFESYNGKHEHSEFAFSYGLGLRFSPFRYLSLFTEYRLAPGDLSYENEGGTYYVYYYSDGTTSGGGPSGTFEHYTKIFSAGLAVNIPF